MAALFLVTSVLVPAASAQSDIYKILETPFYDPDTSGGGNGVCLGSGTLPSSVPDPYNSIFTAAANKYQVAPAFLAALFYAGEHGSSWPNPPPPYGTGGPWATSSAGAEGPFQFLSSTWNTYGIDGNGDGVTDIQDLTDAAFGASKYLSALGAANTTDELKLRKAAADYNGIGDPNASYQTNVWNAYVTFSTGGSTPGTSSCLSSGFANPFPDGWTPGRLDMGYDGHFTKQIVSPCDGNIAYVDPDSNHSSNGGWEGAFMTVHCSNSISDLPSGYFFFAEGLSPTVTQGQSVTAGQQIAVPGWTGYSEGPGGIEWGLANPNDPGNALALSSQQGCPSNGAYGSTVLNFAQWVVQNLGVAPYSADNPSNQPGCA